ncbi:MAG: hypothetical protein ACD_51C00037G0002 [uncultured bacterium]|nr:MAG: hypothetical protein ACD_51C00037G0002 [uncultured bacterium]
MIAVKKHKKVSNDRLVNLFNKVVSKSRIIQESKERKFRDKDREKPNKRKQRAKAVVSAEYRAERARKKHY